jgi:PAS domain S-box-containing protein
MYNDTTSSLKIRIQELENEVKRLRDLIPSELQNEENTSSIISNKDQLATSVINQNYIICEVNEKQREGTNFTASELIGKKCYEVFYALNKPCEDCRLKMVIESGEEDGFLNTYKLNNKVKFEEKHFCPVLKNGEGDERIIVQTKSISNYYNLVDRIGQREEFYKNIFEFAGDGFMVHDDKGNIIEYSRRLAQLLEYSEEEVGQLNIVDFDDPTHSLEFPNRLKVMEEVGCSLFETHFVTKSGRIIPVEANANLIHLSNANIYFVVIRNSTRRKNAENKLQVSEQRFRSLVENATDLIMRFDKNHRHVFVNSAVIPLLNLQPEEFIGKTHEEMGFPKENCEFWAQEIDRAFKNKKQHCVDFSVSIKGDIRYFEWLLIPELNTIGECETIMGIARDITDRKASEEVLNESISTKDKFFSIIAHDLKNPFNALLPISKNLAQNCRKMSTNQIIDAAELLYSSAKQEYNLLENLLEWGRSQMGKIKLNSKPINLQQLVHENSCLYQTQIDKKNIQVKHDYADNIMVLADSYMLDAIVRNLFSNAIKFTQPGGIIQIKIVREDSKVLLSIEDDGIGISEENQKKLFRIDTTYKRVGTCEESGTGLGLILCREFAGKMNAFISLNSTLGKGSIFTLHLPANL